MLSTLLRKSDHWSLMASAVLVIMLVMSANDLHTSMATLVARQETITDNLKRWMASYRALQPIKTEWAETLKGASELDLLALYKALDIESSGLMGNADKLLVDKIERLKFNNLELDASLVYVYTSGGTGSGFVVTAPSWHELVNGLDQLAHRRDLHMQAIIMEVGRDDAAPTAIIHDLAIVIRDAEGKK